MAKLIKERGLPTVILVFDPGSTAQPTCTGISRAEFRKGRKVPNVSYDAEVRERLTILFDIIPGQCNQLSAEQNTLACLHLLPPPVGFLTYACCGDGDGIGGAQESNFLAIRELVFSEWNELPGSLETTTGESGILKRWSGWPAESHLTCIATL
ncbi:uncharacterized protein C8R40DRAFT_1066411 [Lentinula edodes]|uniref:uncharacterized protein n=1 Tax=Lentinula edodes TaxID=5353 RepID=UPI001E8D1EB1|nr:uncharacterized protein C8R40DRAFT_1066411 [Lentinula edodes]KAH7879310.1 hypothetical protein C8R40DRAFT_1066411 [Lentinula edodes]